jgi:hypothetical protein
VPSAVDEQRPILAGDLSEFSVHSLMSAFSLGRQVMTIEVLDARGVCDGRIVMKGGRVLSASAAGRTGAEAVQHLLASAVPARFRVLRETSDRFARAPHIGTLAEVAKLSVAPRRSAAPVFQPSRPPTRVNVMEGSLSDFDVATVLQVVSTARQHTVMEILTQQGTRAGSIQLKAGKVLRAEAGSLHGVAAVRQLLGAPSSFRFAVFRALGASGELPLLGAVDEVLLHAASEEPAKPWARSGIHLAPPLPSPAHLEPDPDEVETLIPPPSARTAADADIDAAIDDAWNYLEDDLENDLEDEVTRVSDQRSPERDRRAAEAPARAPAPRASAGAGAGVPVLDGRLFDFDLGSVLQVAGLSRQLTSVRIFDDLREQVGEVRVQAGQLLAANAQGQRDQAALRFLLHSPRDFYFSVWRQSGHPDLTLTPLGTVSELLQLATAHPPAVSDDEAPRFRAQAPSLPAAARSTLTWKRALGVGVLLGVAVGALVTSRLPWASAPAKPESPSAQVPAASAQVAAASAQVAAASAQGSAQGRPAASAQAHVESLAPPAQNQAASDQVQPPVQAPVAPALAPVQPSPRPRGKSVRSTSFRPLAMRSRAEIASIQGALKLLDYHPGPIDGVIGTLTRTAIATFQFAEGLPADGELTPLTEQQLQTRMRASDSPRTRRSRAAQAPVAPL